MIAFGEKVGGAWLFIYIVRELREMMIRLHVFVYLFIYIAEVVNRKAYIIILNIKYCGEIANSHSG